MDVSGQLHAPVALLLREQLPVPVGLLEAEWAPEPVWTQLYVTNHRKYI
jgi:hypothetical protein